MLQEDLCVPIASYMKQNPILRGKTSYIFVSIKKVQSN
jgi:hypothetical protein